MRSRTKRGIKVGNLSEVPLAVSLIARLQQPLRLLSRIAPLRLAGFGCSLILEVTEALSEAIEKRGLTRSEVAKRLGKIKGFVSQLLAGGRNLTLRTVADIADAIGISLRVAVKGADNSKRATRPRRRDVSVQLLADD